MSNSYTEGSVHKESTAFLAMQTHITKSHPGLRSAPQEVTRGKQTIGYTCPGCDMPPINLGQADEIGVAANSGKGAYTRINTQAAYSANTAQSSRYSMPYRPSQGLNYSTK